MDVDEGNDTEDKDEEGDSPEHITARIQKKVRHYSTDYRSISFAYFVNPSLIPLSLDRRGKSDT